MKDLREDRLLELLSDQTIFGLSMQEQTELGQLKKEFPDWEKHLSLELTAAAIGLSYLDVNNELPANLREKIFANAGEFFAAAEESQKVVGFAPQTEKTDGSSATKSSNAVDSNVAPNRPFWQWLGWGLAAAACVALAIGLWSARNQNQPEMAKNPETVQTPEVVKTPEITRTPEVTPSPESSKTPEVTRTPETVKTPEVTETPKISKTPEIIRTPTPVRTPIPVRTPVPELTTTQKREQLIASAPDVIRTNWTSAKGDQRVSGDVVWSNAQQTGYVRLRNMPVISAGETYQLWIIDERDEKTPVSAGLFNFNAAGEIIIPLNAQLRITKPKQFAISKEKAGGVSVPNPDRIVAIAKI